nr:hypothetical protein [Tanacetum cinerariifolium]
MTKASARRKRSGSDTSITPPTAITTPTTTGAVTPRLTAAAKGKQPAKAKNEGTGSKPGVLDVPSDDSKEEISWNSSDDEETDTQEQDRHDDEGGKKHESDDGKEDDDDDKDGDENDDDNDDEEEIAKIDVHDDIERRGDDNEESENDEESDDEETREEESFDPIPRTPKESEDDGNDELYRDVDINQGRGLQVSQDIKDSHVTLTPVHPDGQQESSSVSSQFVTSMLNPISDVVAPLPTPTPTMTPFIITTITTASHPPIPTTPIPSEVLQNLPTFDLVFRFDERLKSLEANFSEYRQTNPFAKAVSNILEEPVQTTSQIEEPSHLVFETDTPIDFSNFIMNRLGVDTLTPKLLAGPTYELMKGTCKSLTELGYHLEEVYKATTDQLDWINPEGQQYPHNLLQPIPLISDNRGRRVIRFAHFINNDLKYLWGGASSRKYTTSVTKTKAAYYEKIKWIEDLVPRFMWIQGPINYDKHALWGVSHWGRKRQQFYWFAVNRESSLDVYSKRRIIAVTSLKIVEWHNYKHLDWILVRRDDDKVYKFKEGDFKRLRLQDIKDMLLLLVQEKLSNLTVKERFAFNVSFRMFTWSIVIQRRVEDLQLGVESYQKRLNLTKPDTYRSDLKRREAYTAYSNPRGFNYQNKDKKNRGVTITTISHAPIPPTPIPSEVLKNLPTFDSVFRFDERLKSLEVSFSEYRQTIPFAEAVSNISDWLRNSYQRENDEFLQTIDDNMKRIIKEQVKSQVKEQVSKILPRIEQSVNAQLEAEVLTRSSHSSRTSYAIAADLTEMELKKILIEKMEGYKSIQRSDEQRNLYKALVEAYEADKIILETYKERVILKRRHDDDDDDQGKGPSAGSDWGSKRQREGKEPESASAPLEPATRSAGRSTIGSKSRQASASEYAFVEVPVQTTFQIEEPSHPVFETRSEDQPITELEYHLEEVYKATMDQLDCVNPEGQQYPHNLLQPLSLIPDNRGRRVIPFAHFINNDLEYLRGGASSQKYTTSVTKTKAADYGHIKWIEDLFYGFAVNWEYALDVYSKRRVIAVTGLKIVEWHNYKHLYWISVRRDDDKIYKFKEGDFKRRLQDIEDMLQLLKRLNLTKPDTYRSDLKQREAYIAYSNPKGFIYQNKDKKNRLMRIDELQKFNDGVLNNVRNALDDHLKGIRMQYLPQTIWRKGDKDRAAAMIQAIDKMLKTRRIMRSLERFVRGRLYKGDFRFR